MYKSSHHKEFKIDNIHCKWNFIQPQTLENGTRTVLAVRDQRNIIVNPQGARGYALCAKVVTNVTMCQIVDFDTGLHH